MTDKQIKKSSFIKVVMVFFLFLSIDILFFIFSPKVTLESKFIVFIKYLLLFNFYDLFKIRLKMQTYFLKFQLTPERLAEMSGRSKYDFPVNGKGKVRFVDATIRDYRRLVEKLTLAYGEL